LVFGYAQSPTFEVASIKPSPPPSRGRVVGCPSDPGRIACTYMTVSALIWLAYEPSRLEGITGDIGRFANRYDVYVKVPPGSTKEQIRLMWQNLLAERFKLKVHHEPKEVQGYDLVVAKGGPKMKEAAETPPASDSPPPTLVPTGAISAPHLGSDGFPELRPGTTSAMVANKARWRQDAATPEGIATMLSSQLGQPVHDSTGLKGKYAVTLSWVTGPPGAGRGAAVAQPEAGSPIAESSEPEGPTLIEALQSQLGLRLEPKKVTVQVLVVDHVEKPTEN
jgi:uncharacterized protein (TIGR03435 family)